MKNTRPDSTPERCPDASARDNAPAAQASDTAPIRQPAANGAARARPATCASAQEIAGAHRQGPASPPPGPAAAGAPPAGRITVLARTIRNLTGWRRTLLAFGAGALGALAMAPVSFWPVLAISFPILVLLIDGGSGLFPPGPALPLRRRLRTAAGIGWSFGFGYFLASLWWIGAAFLVDADAFGWLMPVAVIAMPAGLALFTALGAIIARLFWSTSRLRLFGFAAGFTLAEWLRGHLLSGFPWNSFGYAFADTLVLMQSAALVGVWGLTFFALLLLSTPALLAEGRRGVAACLVALAVIGAAALWGRERLAAHPTQFVPGVALRLMQPNLPQDQKFQYGRRQEILADYLTLSARPSLARPGGLADVTHLIWPESAFPFIYEREPWAAEAIAAILPDNVTLITGAVRHGPPPPGQVSPFFNAVRVIGADGSIGMSTDKVHLVPFGEYLPFQAALERLGFQQLTKVRGGFSAADRLRRLTVPGLPPVAPLVCYEAIFPGAVVPQDEPGPRPGLMLNVTNDGWFGATPGPFQHFVQARLRAVEEGLPMIRAANTGISAVIDPMGRTLARTRLGEAAILDASLPAPLAGPPVVARAGAPLLFAFIFIALGIAFLPIYRRFTR